LLRGNKGAGIEQTKRKWIFPAETPEGEFCLDENGNEIEHSNAVCKCFIGTTVEASREVVRRSLLHEDNHPSFLSCTITYESQGIVEQEGEAMEGSVKESIAKLWKKLGDIPVDNDGCIEEPFIHLPTVNFPTGTNREDIWHWFEETFGVSVHSLMYPKE